MKRNSIRNAAIGAALLLGVAGALFLWRLIAIDECLDRGSTWLVNNSTCYGSPSEAVQGM